MKENAGPHFDDERTLLTARRVVPLEKIEAKARHRRQWFLGGAFAIAMMLGAASALVASYLKFRNVPQTAPQIAIEQPVEPEVAPAQVAVAPPAVEEATPDDSVAGSENLEEETNTPITPKREAPRRRALAERHDAEPIEQRDTRGISEEDQLQQIRDAVLYDQWQERRARRALRRERRQSERYNHRDLSDLNEIFEGRRRP